MCSETKDPNTVVVCCFVMLLCTWAWERAEVSFKKVEKITNDKTTRPYKGYICRHREPGLESMERARQKDFPVFTPHVERVSLFYQLHLSVESHDCLMSTSAWNAPSSISQDFIWTNPSARHLHAQLVTTQVPVLSCRCRPRSWAKRLMWKSPPCTPNRYPEGPKDSDRKTRENERILMV